MNEYSASQILLMIFGGGGAITGVISLLVFVAGRLDKKREQRAAELTTHLSNSADIRRIEIEQRAANNKSIIDQLWKMLDEEKEDVARLKSEVEILRNSERLTQKTTAAIYDAIRKLRRQLDVIELLVMNSGDAELVMKEVSAIKKQLDDLETILP